MGETATKIESKYYTTDKNGNLIFETSNTTPGVGKGGPYQTNEVTLTKGTAYTVITELTYTVGGVNQVTKAIT